MGGCQLTAIIQVNCQLQREICSGVWNICGSSKVPIKNICHKETFERLLIFCFNSKSIPHLWFQEARQFNEMMENEL